jgi:DNA-binding NarL/FixJ family response regulator
VPSSPPSPLRLVLVEDSDAYAALVERRLAEEPDPPALVRFSRLDEALRHLSYVHADCVLLDVGLPDAQDVEGVERILEVAPTVPLVVLTGSEDEGLALRLLRAGAQDHVVKGTRSSAAAAATTKPRGGPPTPPFRCRRSPPCDCATRPPARLPCSPAWASSSPSRRSGASPS